MNRLRLSVTIFFFVNGFLHANVMARIPEFKASLQITNTQLGSFLFSMSLGALLAMPATGWLAVKYGSHKVTKIIGLLFCMAIPLLFLFQNHLYIALCFLVLGMCTGGMDVAMNGQAVHVENSLNKKIMSTFHAAFSIGMAVGSGLGALFSKFHIALIHHILGVSIVALFAIYWASVYLMAIDSSAQKSRSTHKKSAFWQVLPYGVVAFCCMIVEGSMVDWSALYLHKVLGQSPSNAAMGFGLFATGMTLARLFGDYFGQRYSSRQILLADAVIAIASLSIILLTPYTWLAYIGFFMVGVGVATMVPVIFSTAGNLPHIDPTVGISIASSIGYLGFFVGPPSIGYLADLYSLRIGIGFSLVLAIIMLFLVLIFVKKVKIHRVA